MKRGRVILVLGVFVWGIGSAALASADEGSWDTASSDLLTGTWTEMYGPEGPGQPGCELAAMADDGMQWMMGGAFILAPASGEDNGDGTITYTTDYGNESDPGASSLALAEAPTLWGDAITFTNLTLTVVATIDMNSGDYLGGTFAGRANAAGGWVINISGTLMRTGFLGEPGEPPIGHEGTVDYMEVTIEREPLIVPLDIKPGSCPNAFNVWSRGKFPVAVLGTDDFDVTMIDLASVVLSRADGVGGSVAPLEGPPGPHSTYHDVGTPFEGEGCECHELCGDGIEDMSLKFSTPAVAETLELRDLEHGDFVELIVTGVLLDDGRPFVASDCVVIKGKSKGNHGRRRLGQ